MKVSQSFVNNGVVITGEVDGDILEKFLEAVKELAEGKGNRLSNTEQAVEMAGTDMILQWSESARASLKSSNSYVNAIEAGRHYPNEGSKLNYYIEHNQQTRDGKSIALLLEYGYEAFDMKEKILKGRDKVIIPFQYGAPGQHSLPALSKSIYNLAKKHLTAFKWNEAAGHEVSDIKWFAGLHGAMNPQKTKNFTVLNAPASNFPGPRKRPNMGFTTTRYAAAATINYKWKTGQFKGMRANKFKSGAQNAIHSFTIFRTISKKSATDSWIHPGEIAHRIFNTALDRNIPKIRPLLEKGIALDAEALMAS